MRANFHSPFKACVLDRMGAIRKIKRFVKERTSSEQTLNLCHKDKKSFFRYINVV